MLRSARCGSRSSARAESGAISAGGSPRPALTSRFSRAARTSRRCARAACASPARRATCTCPASRRRAIPPRSVPADVVFFAVKLYDTESALAMLPPLVGPEHPRHRVPERRRDGRVADARGRRRAHRRRRVVRLGGDRRARRHQAHGDGSSDLRDARRIAIGAARGAARGLPARRLPVDAEPGHHRRDLDQVRPPLGLQRHDRRHARPDRRRSSTIRICWRC